MRVSLFKALAVGSLGLAVLFTDPLAAQQRTGRGAFQVGYQAPDIDGLNASLVANGFPEFGDGFLTLGGFGLAARGRLLIGGEGHGFVSREETTADGEFRTRLGGGYGLFNLGYLAVSNERLDLYPIFGIGGGMIQLDLIERSSPVFGEVLDDAGTSTRLTTEDFLLSAALGADYRLGGIHGDKDDRGGLFVGLRAGWIWAPGDTQWTLDELNEVAGGPSVGPTGFFVRASIGGWGGR